MSDTLPTEREKKRVIWYRGDQYLVTAQSGLLLRIETLMITAIWVSTLRCFLIFLSNYIALYYISSSSLLLGLWIYWFYIVIGFTHTHLFTYLIYSYISLTRKKYSVIPPLIPAVECADRWWTQFSYFIYIPHFYTLYQTRPAWRGRGGDNWRNCIQHKGKHGRN